MVTSVRGTTHQTDNCPMSGSRDDHRMGTRERRHERGQARARRSLIRIGGEIRDARRSIDVSQRVAAAAVGMSHSVYGRIERAEMPDVSVRQLSLAAAAVGLDLAMTCHPNGDPVRDRAHAALLARFRARLPEGAALRLEVPVTRDPLDLRAWDAVIFLGGRIGIEAETRVADVQALLRKVEKKRIDAGFDRVLLVLADTRHNRRTFALHHRLMGESFPLKPRATWAALMAGRAPASSGIVFA